jgi:hypothetical protein
MQEHEKGIVYLIALGALIGLGKLLASNEVITPRLALGRAILGSATSTVAGVALVQFPSIPLPALVGIGAGLGILGAQYLEAWLKKKTDTVGASNATKP